MEGGWFGWYRYQNVWNDSQRSAVISVRFITFHFAPTLKGGTFIIAPVHLKIFNFVTKVGKPCISVLWSFTIKTNDKERYFHIIMLHNHVFVYFLCHSVITIAVIIVQDFKTF